MDLIQYKEAYSPIKVLDQLNFGKVDSETEDDLDRKFVKTEDFDSLLLHDTSIVIGAKGAGKSALFEYMTRWKGSAKIIGGDRLRHKIIVGATGFGDVKEISTQDIDQISKYPEFSFDKLWSLYIAVKGAFAIAEEGYSSKGALGDFLRATHKVTDYRILPILKSLWKSVIGQTPETFTISLTGVGNVAINQGKNPIDVQDILQEIDDSLNERGEELWLLFDKIDELLAGNHDLRIKAVESLFQMHLSVMRRFPRIRIKIFCRKDIWRQVNFTNKSHTTGKIVEMSWDEEKLIRMLMKRALVSDAPYQYLLDRHRYIGNQSLDDLGYHQVEALFYSIFDRTVYPRRTNVGEKAKKEAELFKWMLDRSKDGEGNIYPRELINFCNVSVKIQRDQSRSHRQENGRSSEALVSGGAVLKSYYEVSKIRCETYLAEFPQLQKHFQRFAGKPGRVSKDDLMKIMDGLDPNGEVMLRWFCDIVGVLTPTQNSHWTVAEEFEVPRLYRAGLKTTMKGRP